MSTREIPSCTDRSTFRVDWYSHRATFAPYIQHEPRVSSRGFQQTLRRGMSVIYTRGMVVNAVERAVTFFDGDRLPAILVFSDKFPHVDVRIGGSYLP